MDRALIIGIWRWATECIIIMHLPRKSPAQNQNISHKRIPIGGDPSISIRKITKPTYKLGRTLEQLRIPIFVLRRCRQQPLHPIRYLQPTIPASYLSCLRFGTDSSHFTGCRLKNGQSGTHIYASGIFEQVSNTWFEWNRIENDGIHQLLTITEITTAARQT